MATINAKDKLEDLNLNLTDYDEIVIGSPIWNARLSSPINTIFHELDFSNKKLTFLFYSGSGAGPKAVKKVLSKYPNAKIIFLKEPQKHKEELKKIKNI